MSIVRSMENPKEIPVYQFTLVVGKSWHAQPLHTRSKGRRETQRLKPEQPLHYVDAQWAEA